MYQGRTAHTCGSLFLATGFLDIASMFMIMAVDAEQFPVAAIRRIIFVVVVFVVHRELSKLFALKFTGTAATHGREKLQRLFPVSRLTLLLLPAHLRDHAVSVPGIFVI